MNKKNTTIVINGFKISTLMASMTTRDQFQCQQINHSACYTCYLIELSMLAKKLHLMKTIKKCSCSKNSTILYIACFIVYKDSRINLPKISK